MNNRRIDAIVKTLVSALKTGHALNAYHLMELYTTIDPEPDVDCGADEYISWCNMRTAICFSIMEAYRAGQDKPA